MITRKPANGFTLVEVMVALSVSAVVLLGVGMAFSTIADHADRAVQIGRDNDARQNAQRELRRIVGATDIGAEPFVGTDSLASFGSWCSQPAGWLARCSVTVRLDRSCRCVAVSEAPGMQFHLSDEVTAGRLLYYVGGTAGGVFAPSWRSTLNPPMALAVASDRDTLFFRVGSPE